MLQTPAALAVEPTGLADCLTKTQKVDFGNLVRIGSYAGFHMKNNATSTSAANPPTAQ